MGPVGPAGPSGADGDSVIGLSLGLGDRNCPNGGSQFTSANNVVTYACNGASGPSGPMGPAGAQGPKGDPGPSIIFTGDCAGSSCAPCDYSGKDPEAVGVECSNDTEYAEVTIAAASGDRIIDCRASGTAEVDWNVSGSFSCGCGGGTYNVFGDIVDDTTERFRAGPSFYERVTRLEQPSTSGCDPSQTIVDPAVNYYAWWEAQRTFRLPSNTSGTYTLRLEQNGVTPQGGFGCRTNQGTYDVSHDVTFYCVAVDPL